MTLIEARKIITDGLHFVEAHTKEFNYATYETFDVLYDLVENCETENNPITDIITASADWFKRVATNDDIAWYDIESRLRLTSSVIIAIANVAECEGKVTRAGLMSMIRDLWEYTVRG